MQTPRRDIRDGSLEMSIGPDVTSRAAHRYFSERLNERVLLGAGALQELCGIGRSPM